MGIGPLAGQLLESIVIHYLDARYPQLAAIRSYLEKGMFPEDLAWSYLQIVEPLVRLAQDHPNLLKRPPITEELFADGPPDIELGMLLERPEVRFGIRLRDRPRAITLSGSAGSGKTTTMLKLIEGIHELNARDPGRFIVLVVFDVKNSFGQLASDPGCIRLSVYDCNTKLSLAAPEGLPAHAWINQIASCLASRAGLVAAWTCFANMIRFLLAAMNPNPTPGQPLRWPSLKLLLQLATKVPLTTFAAKQDYEKSLIQVLEAATKATTVFDCFTGLDIERDVIQPRKHLVLEMPNFTPAWLRRLIQDLILTQILSGRIQRRQKVRQTEVVIVLDEGDQDATYESDKHFQDLMSPLALTLRMGREFGIMPVVGLGQLCGASPYVLSEPLYHFVFSQSDAHSVRAACQTLMLPQGAEAMLPSLKPGVCIARESQGPWTHPMLVKMDYVAPGSDQLPENYDAVPFIPHQDLDQMPELKEALNELTDQKMNENLRQDRTKNLSKDAQRLLNTIAAHPWAPAAALWKLSGKVPTASVQKSVRKQLEDRKLADNDEQRMGRANVLLYSLTDKGSEYLGLDPLKRIGRGGITHQHISHWIAECGRREGYEAHCEWVATGTSHPTDCAWQISNGRWDVFEVLVTSQDNLTDHLTTLSASPAVRNITVVCLQKQIVTDISAKLATEPIVKQLGDRLCWEVAETYLRKLYP